MGEAECQNQVIAETDQKTGSRKERAKGTGFLATALVTWDSLSSVRVEAGGKNVCHTH